MTNLITPFGEKLHPMTRYQFQELSLFFIVPLFQTSPIVPIFGPHLFLTNLITPLSEKHPMKNLITPFGEKIPMTNLITPFGEKFNPVFTPNFTPILLYPLFQTSPIVSIFGPHLFLTNLITPLSEKHPMTNLIIPLGEKFYPIFYP